MYARGDQRQEEHGQQLGIDAPSDVPLGHAHLLHDLEAVLILVALGHLLVVDDEHGGKEEHDAQRDAQEEQPAVGAVEVIAVLRAALDVVAHVPAAGCVQALAQLAVQLTPDRNLHVVLRMHVHAVEPLHIQQLVAPGVGQAGEGLENRLEVRHDEDQMGEHVHGRTAVHREGIKLLHDAQLRAAEDGELVRPVGVARGIDQRLAGVQHLICARKAVVVLQGDEVEHPHVAVNVYGIVLEVGGIGVELRALETAGDLRVAVLRHLIGGHAVIRAGLHGGGAHDLQRRIVAGDDAAKE